MVVKEPGSIYFHWVFYPKTHKTQNTKHLHVPKVCDPCMRFERWKDVTG